MNGFDRPREEVLLYGGPVIGFGAGWYVHRRLDSARAAREATSKFRTAFADALAQVYPIPRPWPGDVKRYFDGVFPRLQAAVVAYRPFVEPEKVEDFDDAWRRFHHAYAEDQATDGVAECVWHHYEAYADNPDAKVRLRWNVHALLKFAGEPDYEGMKKPRKFSVAG